VSGRRVHLAAQLVGPGSGPGGPIDPASLAHTARTLERGGFDLLVLDAALRPPDGPGRVHDLDAVARSSPVPVLAALAAVTGRIGLAATIATDHEEPYEAARRMATLDHLSDGRAGWVVARGPEAGAHDADRRAAVGRAAVGGAARAREFVEVARRLDTGDDLTGTVHHDGPHFRVMGSTGLPVPPQAAPVIVHVGDAPEDRETAAAAADVVVRSFPVAVPVGDGPTVESQAPADDLARRLAAHGRRREDLLVLSRATFVLGTTPERATELAGRDTRRRPDLVGTASQVATAIADHVASGAADGFVLAPHRVADGFDAFVDEVVPDLVARGVLRDGYEGTTLREHLGLGPAATPSGPLDASAGARPQG